MIETSSPATGSLLLASSGLGAALGQAIGFAMLRVGGLPQSPDQILAGQWNGTSLAGSLAMLDAAVESGAWTQTHLQAFLDTLDLTDFVRGDPARLAALQDGLVHDPLLSVLSQAGLGASFFLGDRMPVPTLAAAAQALAAILAVPENSAPVIAPAAPDAVELAEGGAVILHLADYFQDADGDDLTFTVTGGSGRLSVQLTAEGDLVIAPGYASSGLHDLRVTASDGQSSISHDIGVTVTEAGAGTRIMSADFSRSLGEAETFEDALAIAGRSRAIDIRDQSALGDAAHLISTDNLVLRSASEVTTSLILLNPARVITLLGEFNANVVGNALANVVYGGSGRDGVAGGAGIDQLYGNLGDDFLSGGADGDKLWGGAGRDNLAGDAGDDQLFGGDGDDWLHGGGGRDQATGGAGADTFDFQAGDGTFILRDMTAGEDVIRLQGFAGISDFESLMAQASIQVVDNQIRLGIGSDQLQISGLGSAGSLTADLFLFA